jgi:hypothetical protein
MRLHHQQCFLINNYGAGAAGGIVCRDRRQRHGMLGIRNDQTLDLITMAARQMQMPSLARRALWLLSTSAGRRVGANGARLMV